MVNKITYGIAIAVAAAGLAAGYSNSEPLATANMYNAEGTVNNGVPAQLIVMEPMYLTAKQDERCTDCDFSDSPLELIAGEKDAEF